MKLDELKFSLKNLLHRKLRSFLSSLSILIGITAIFALVSFGLGMDAYIQQVAEDAGSHTLMVMGKGIGAPGTDENFFLTEDDVNFISKIKGVKEVVGFYVRIAEIEYKGEEKFIFMMGWDPTKQDFIEAVFTAGVEVGRPLKPGETNKVNLGYSYKLADKIFERALKTGDKVQINGEEFKIVGFYEEIGNAQDDSNVYISDEAMELLFDDIKGTYGFLSLEAEKSEDPGELADKVKEKLRKFKGQEEGKEDFYVQTFADILEIYGNILVIINGVLVLIALISLVVATVNIMNTMYTAVIERTKEIGVMKAIGAKNSTIMMLFIIESGFLSLVGGMVGVFFGWLIASAGGAAAASGGYSFLKPIFPWWLIAGCLVFSFVVGALAGLFPARQASKLQPVDALRYE